jgi:hypothetical protein
MFNRRCKYGVSRFEMEQRFVMKFAIFLVIKNMEFNRLFQSPYIVTELQ